MTRIGALSTLLISSVCLHGAASDDPVADELSSRWVSAYNSGDVETLAAIYASDARLQNGHCPAVVGRSDIASYWDRDMGDQPVKTRLEVLDSLIVDDIAYVSGNYEVESVDAAHPPVVGTYSQIWRREQATWTVHRETWINLSCVKLRMRPDPEPGAVPTGPDLAA